MRIIHLPMIFALLFVMGGIGLFTAHARLQDSAAGMIDAQLLDSELRMRQVRVIGADSETLRYFDTDNILQTEPIETFLQMRFVERGANVSAQSPPRLVELTNGSRIAGQLVGATEDGQSITWRHPLFGNVIVSLDDLAVMHHQSPITAQAVAGLDQVILTNGDRMSGYVFAITATQVEFQVSTGADTDADSPTVQLPLDRIAGVRMNNSSVAADDARFRLHLYDGSRVSVQLESISETHLTVKLAMGQSADETEAVQLPLRVIERLDIISPGRQLVSLADLPREVTAGGEVFTRAWPPVVVQGNLYLHAPLTLAIDLPAGATHLTALAQLNISDDETDLSNVQWANFHVIVRKENEELTRVHIHAAQREHRINLPVEAGRLIIELEPGINGPVMDRLRLVDAMVLIRE